MMNTFSMTIDPGARSDWDFSFSMFKNFDLSSKCIYFSKTIVL